MYVELYCFNLSLTSSYACNWLIHLLAGALADVHVQEANIFLDQLHPHRFAIEDSSSQLKHQSLVIQAESSKPNQSGETGIQLHFFMLLYMLATIDYTLLAGAWSDVLCRLSVIEG